MDCSPAGHVTQGLAQAPRAARVCTGVHAQPGLTLKPLWWADSPEHMNAAVQALPQGTGSTMTQLYRSSDQT